MHPYIPNTPSEQEEMLKAIGIASMDALFADIPEAVRLQRELRLPAPLNEMALRAHIKQLSETNLHAENHVCFAGGGVYDHYIPAVINHLAGRQEFYTAYTPYQAEMSQGTLQAVFEYQTMMARLTGMDVSNASVYDGATACAEAMLMACGIHGGDEVVLPDTLNPEYARVCQTYAQYRGITLRRAAHDAQTGCADADALAALIGPKTACVLVQSPNYYGIIEDIAALTPIAKQHGALLIAVVDPISLALLASPGWLGADIAVGEGQALGNPMSFGGPGFGFIACKKAYQRKLPGRIVGQTDDAQGRRGFVLTLQAREQHIRRENATSNICSNQALCALRAAMYLAVMGDDGLRSVAAESMRNAHSLCDALTADGRFTRRFTGPFFKEFALNVAGDVPGLRQSMLKEGYFAGIELPGSGLLLAATEKQTNAQIQAFAQKAVTLL